MIIEIILIGDWKKRGFRGRVEKKEEYLREKVLQGIGVKELREWGGESTEMKYV